MHECDHFLSQARFWILFDLSFPYAIPYFRVVRSFFVNVIRGFSTAFWGFGIVVTYGGELSELSAWILDWVLANGG